ncbi:MAG: PilZ domain-containing protein [Treponema sp.]|nr:PilZ domain-containing protein [Treponema sp.]
MLFFKTGERTETALSQSGPTRAPRYDCIATVRINGFDGRAILRNINQGGFRMESKTYAALTVNEHYTLEIQPEEVANVNSFGLTVEVRWIRSTEHNFNVGFRIIKQSADRAFEKYLEYIKNINVRH